MVVIIMGSKSDYPVVEKGIRILDEFGVPYEVKAFSAHRTPKELVRYIESLDSRGASAVIAVAGKAAALPGVIAGHTILPVIGVPVETKFMGGLDSLLSICQMPGGVPVASMGIGDSGMVNAALFAIHIKALNDREIAEKLVSYREKMAKGVLDANDSLS